MATTLPVPQTPEPPPDFQDTALRRRATFILIPLVLLVGIMVGLYGIGGERVSAWLIKEATGLHAEVRGESGFSLFPRFQVVAEDLIVYPTAPLGGLETANPVLRAARFEARVSLTALAAPRLEVTDLTLIRPRFNLIRTAPGSTNWQSRSSTRRLPIQINRLRIQGAGLRYSDNRLDRQVLVDNIDLDGGFEGESDRYRLSVAGDVAREPLYLEATFGNLGLADKGGMISVDILSQSGLGAVDLNGTLGLAGGDLARLDLKLAGSVDTVAPLQRALPRLPELSDPLLVAGDIRLRQNRLSVRELDLQTGGARMRGEIDLDLNLSAPQVNAAFSTSALDLGALLGLSGDVIQGGGEEGLRWPLGGQATLQWSGLLLQGVTGGPGAASVSWAPGPANLSFRVQEIDVAQGRLSLEGQMTSSEGRRAIRLAGEGSTLDARDVLSLLKVRAPSGNLNVNLDVLAVGQSIEDWRRSLYGQGAVQLIDAAWSEGEVAKAVGTRRGQAPSLLRRAEAALTIENGIVRADQIVLEGDQGSANGRLDYDLVSGEVTGTLRRTGGADRPQTVEIKAPLKSALGATSPK